MFATKDRQAKCKREKDKNSEEDNIEYIEIE